MGGRIRYSFVLVAAAVAAAFCFCCCHDQWIDLICVAVIFARVVVWLGVSWRYTNKNSF